MTFCAKRCPLDAHVVHNAVSRDPCGARARVYLNASYALSVVRNGLVLRCRANEHVFSVVHGYARSRGKVVETFVESHD